MVETAAHILEELAPLSPPRTTERDTRPPTDDPVLAALGHDPASLDVLVARSGWPTHLLNAQLLTLELQGLVARLPGGLFQRLDRS